MEVAKSEIKVSTSQAVKYIYKLKSRSSCKSTNYVKTTEYANFKALSTKLDK